MFDPMFLFYPEMMFYNINRMEIKYFMVIILYSFVFFDETIVNGKTSKFTKSNL